MVSKHFLMIQYKSKYNQGALTANPKCYVSRWNAVGQASTDVIKRATQEGHSSEANNMDLLL